MFVIPSINFTSWLKRPKAVIISSDHVASQHMTLAAPMSLFSFFLDKTWILGMKTFFLWNFFFTFLTKLFLLSFWQTNPFVYVFDIIFFIYIFDKIILIFTLWQNVIFTIWRNFFLAKHFFIWRNLIWRNFIWPFPGFARFDTTPVVLIFFKRLDRQTNLLNYIIDYSC